MITAREIMTEGAESTFISDSVAEAARKMRDLGVGALAICEENDRLAGMLTDRDIVVRCVAEGEDPATMKVAGLVSGKPVTIGADESLEETLRIMIEYGLRRLPVIDEMRLVGMVSQADVTRTLPGDTVGTLVAAISLSRASGTPS